MIEILMIFYLLPMTIVSLYAYFDKDTKVLGDFFKYTPYIFTPLFNLFCTVLLFGWSVGKLYNKTKINNSLKNWWKKLMNTKIK